MTKPAVPRIDGIIARDAPVAVVFRRGPSRWTQLLKWNLESDEVTAGQWIRARVYTDFCDLSPDGRRLIASFSDYSQRRRDMAAQHNLKYDFMACTWTAVSRLPYFTATALWFGDSCGGGGGYWEADDILKLHGHPEPAERASQPPPSVTVKKIGRNEGRDAVLDHRRRARGWETVSAFTTTMEPPRLTFKEVKRDLMDLLKGDPKTRSNAVFDLFAGAVMPRWEMKDKGIYIKPFKGGSLRHEEGLRRESRWPEHRHVWQLCGLGGDVVKEWRPLPFQPQFLDVDHSGRVVYGEDGCLWAWADFPWGAPTLVADLRGNKPTNVPPPDWAREW